MDERQPNRGNDEEGERQRRLRAAAKLLALGALRVMRQAPQDEAPCDVATASPASGEKGVPPRRPRTPTPRQRSSR
jgi:hypothetical protein